MIYLVRTSIKDSNYTQRTTLDGVEYELIFRFNTRESKWYVDVLDNDGNMLAGGRKLVVNSFLWKGEDPQIMFPGKFFLFDTTGNGTESGLRDLGDRVILMYISGDSVTD